jgi:molybdate transport system ATP-binding protein
VRIRVEIHHQLERIRLDVALDVEGGLVALFGPSGAGKTRTLETIAGLFRPTTGMIALDEDVLTDTARRIWIPPHRRRIAYVFQDSRLFPHLTVRQNLAYGGWFSEHRTDSGATMDEVVALLDLGPLLTRLPGRLSGGEGRRVALGRALLSRPRLLLLDEPLGSLEVTKRQEILPYLDRLLTEFRLPMIYVTHDWEEVRQRATTVVHIQNGRAGVRS